MAKGSTYNIIELVGTSDKSWEEAVKLAVETAAESVRDLRVAEIIKLDVTVADGKVTSYRAKINLSFKYQKEAQLKGKQRITFGICQSRRHQPLPDTYLSF